VHSLQTGDTVRAAQPTILLDWTASSDGSGIDQYLVGFSESATPDPSALTRIGPSATRHLEFTPGDVQTLYAHVLIDDAFGNRTVQTVGPIFIDTPSTPDHIASLDDSAWLMSGASLVGADNALHALDPQKDVQQFFTTWNADTLRFAWTGTDTVTDFTLSQGDTQDGTIP
jgi:hypothetical protein